ncbi:MAG TPA: hypothetical protein VF916_10945, partial [Ktedonobacterales bacterium]
VGDRLHAGADGFTSLAVLFGALGVLAGFPLADPLVGLSIIAAILVIVKDTRRLGRVPWKLNRAVVSAARARRTADQQS